MRISDWSSDGCSSDLCRFVPFDAMPVDDWRWSMRNELDLVFYATRFACASLQRQGGVVINIASVAGMAGSGPGGAAHAAAKCAAIAWTKQLARAGAPFGIRAMAPITCVSPTRWAAGRVDATHPPGARRQESGLPEE